MNEWKYKKTFFVLFFHLLVHVLHLYQFHLIIVHDDVYQDIVLVKMHVQEFVLNDHQNKFEHDELDFLAEDREVHWIDLLRMCFSLFTLYFILLKFYLSKLNLYLVITIVWPNNRMGYVVVVVFHLTWWFLCWRWFIWICQLYIHIYIYIYIHVYVRKNNIFVSSVLTTNDFSPFCFIFILFSCFIIYSCLICHCLSINEYMFVVVSFWRYDNLLRNDILLLALTNHILT